MPSTRKSAWSYVAKRAELLPKSIHLSFNDEADGDAYVARLEQLLDAGIIPPEFTERAGAMTRYSICWY